MTSPLVPLTNPEILEKIRKMQVKMDKLILRTPTSPIRNALSDVNVMLLRAQLVLTETIKETNVASQQLPGDVPNI